MKKATYDHMPAKFEAVGDGSIVYHFGIEEVVIEEKTQWKCYEVTIWGAISGDKLTTLVMEAMYGNGIEAKYINDYNAAVLGVLDGSYVDKYKAFLLERNTLKASIDTDCANLII